jgi:hypothetical protein
MGPFGCDLSEVRLENLAKASDFQAEYEGSIPFTRSNDFKSLAEAQLSIPNRWRLLIPNPDQFLFVLHAVSSCR